MSQQKPSKRIFTIITGLAFLCLMGYRIVGMSRNGMQQPEETAQAKAASVEQQLQAQEKGYALVLEREPENQTALQGLVDARLKMKDFAGAVDPLKKLVGLNPEKQKYKALLAKVKQQADNEESDR